MNSETVLNDALIYQGGGKNMQFLPWSCFWVIVFLHTFPWVFQFLSTQGIEEYEMEILKLQTSKRSAHHGVILWRRDQSAELKTLLKSNFLDLAFCWFK